MGDKIFFHMVSFRDMALRSKIVSLSLPFVIVLVSLAHFVAVSSFDVTRHQGTGFGMFSAVDSPTLRYVTIEASDNENNKYVLDVNAENVINTPHRENFVYMPTEYTAHLFFNEIKDIQWCIDGNSTGKAAHLILCNSSRSDVDELNLSEMNEVVIYLYSSEYDSEKQEVSFALESKHDVIL